MCNPTIIKRHIPFGWIVQATCSCGAKTAELVYRKPADEGKTTESALSALKHMHSTD